MAVIEPQLKSQRLISLDVYRGLTMFLLIAEGALIYRALDGLFPESGLIRQFFHHPWNGLRFWDLIQPFFMFIVGVAMPFSLRKRLAQGGEWNKVFRHILKRCFLLFLFGVGLHCVYSGELVFELWNVLTQLSFTILVTFLLINLPLRTQLAISMGLLLLTEILYRVYDPAAPFVKGENFGSWMDMILMGKISSGGWAAINCIPTAAHTIWGAMCGKILLSSRSDGQKIKVFLFAAAVGLFIGYGLDWLNITPIIKRISTTSFVFASGGWALAALAFFYWLVDVKKVQSWTRFFIIVGMNSIFIYLFAEVLGHRWLVDFVQIFNFGVFGALGFSEPILNLFNAVITLGLMWGLCYFLYKKKIFFKI